LGCGEPLLKHRVIVRVKIPQLRLGGVVDMDMREMGMKQAARVMLSAFMLVNMRTRSLNESRKQGQNHAESGKAKSHSGPILARPQLGAARSYGESARCPQKFTGRTHRELMPPVYGCACDADPDSADVLYQLVVPVSTESNVYLESLRTGAARLGMGTGEPSANESPNVLKVSLLCVTIVPADATTFLLTARIPTVLEMPV
jgi:hypothetical protein